MLKPQDLPLLLCAALMALPLAVVTLFVRHVVTTLRRSRS
jgi:hypothetical protein